MRFYRETVPSDDELFQIIKGESNLVNYIAEQVKFSKKVIKSVSSPPYLPEALIWENISSKLKNNDLKYFHLAYSGLLLEWGLWRINEDRKTGVTFRFLPKKYITQKFYIFDDKACIVRLKDPLTDNFFDCGILIKEKNWVLEYARKFDELWNKAYQLKYLKNKCIIKKKMLREKLNESEYQMLSRILERGKYTVTHDLRVGDIKEILNSLERKRLIVPFEKAVLGYVANIKFFLGEEHSF